ncbi:centromere/kinetochore protein zw10 homolog [Mya arenaria]|uniref:centromere/kinetochore protein zw10 homolog n=1 Tax=Mya arenaria TaxID=6604 RepID=UPI0022E04A70|nr:centromere/kinetochore protein zw10 homolog [Mya arenaria]
MASFVAEVLTSTGQLETQEASSKLQQLSKRIDNLKLQVYDVTTSKYSKFQAELVTTEQLVSDVEGIKTEMATVSDRIENQIKSQLHKSTVDFENLTGKLEEVNTLMVVLEKLVNLQDGLEAMEEAVQHHDYSKAADNLHMVKALLGQKVFRHEDELSILTAIQQEAAIQTERVISEMFEKWKTLIQWKIPSEKNREEKEVRVVELKINSKGDNVDLLEKVVFGMEKVNVLEEKMKKFGEWLFTHMIKSIVTENRCEVSTSENAAGFVLTLEIRPVEDTGVPVLPQQVFALMDKILRFLNQNVLHVVIGSAASENENPTTLMSILGGHLANKTLDLIVKECLIKAIPGSNKNIEELDKVIIITNEVQKKLIEMNFIESDNAILPDFVQNVNTLFANKKCQELLEMARKLMTTEVHNTVRVSHEKPLGVLPPLVDGAGGKKARKEELAAESPLSVNTFRLPACHISTSIQELMTMAYETLQEASSSSKQCAVQLFCAVRSMFEMFCSVFPIYHKRSLDTLPQFTALHYNNCMYIAHHLMTLGHQFSKRLPETINSTFVDLVPQIRRLGSESFIQQLVKQKAQMSEYLSSANGFLNVSEQATFLASEKAIKQVLHQLTHLQNVWMEVLPPSNYRKAIGGLLNGVVMELVDSVVELEDISADDAVQLSRLINSIVERAPELFKVPSEESSNTTVELQRNVAKWQRFRELDMVLNASMIDISERWAEGKGPLAIAFTANEIKQLIRALFQNTDRRAAMLNKIK